MSAAALRVTGLAAGYGQRSILNDLNLEVASGESVALIGPNGCGKSTFLKAVMDEVVESAGEIWHLGEDISKFPTDKIAARGIGYVRQRRNIFTTLTVHQNLDIAAIRGAPEGRLETLLSEFPVLRERLSVRAGLLSGGERQALAVAMALMRPISLLLVDEPIAGLSQKAAERILTGIRSLREQDGFGMIVVEHRLKLIQPHVDRVAIMVNGNVAEDTSDTSILTDRLRLERFYSL